jgi:hypothetical protein
MKKLLLATALLSSHLMAPSAQALTWEAAARLRTFESYAEYFRQGQTLQISEFLSEPNSSGVRIGSLNLSCNVITQNATATGIGRNSARYVSATGTYRISAIGIADEYLTSTQFKVQSCSTILGLSTIVHNCDNSTSFWDRHGLGVEGQARIREINLLLSTYGDPLDLNFHLFGNPTAGDALVIQWEQPFNPWTTSAPAREGDRAISVRTEIRKLGDRYFIRGQFQSRDFLYGTCVAAGTEE